MTQLKSAIKGKITREMKIVAREEDVESISFGKE
jgi:thiamine biosynthesis protein ThiC